MVEFSHDPNATMANAVDSSGLVDELQNTPNLLMWITDSCHSNTAKAFRSMDDSKPEQGFLQVETSLLRDLTQQCRPLSTFI